LNGIPDDLDLATKVPAKIDSLLLLLLPLELVKVHIKLTAVMSWALKSIVAKDDEVVEPDRALVPLVPGRCPEADTTGGWVSLINSQDADAASPTARVLNTYVPSGSEVYVTGDEQGAQPACGLSSHSNDTPAEEPVVVPSSKEMVVWLVMWGGAERILAVTTEHVVVAEEEEEEEEEEDDDEGIAKVPWKFPLTTNE